MTESSGADRPGSKTVLVSGATGNQGGAVVDALLAEPERWRVRALTRNPLGKKAAVLAARGVEVVGGDLTDAASLAEALNGAYGAFSVQNSQSAGAAKEEQQGVTFANAAKAAGVQHFVYTSVGGAERDSGVGHFETKWRIEQHIREIGLPATILRPVSFMEGVGATGMQGAVGLGIFTKAVPPTMPLQMIAVHDIGVFARIAWSDPDRHLGQAYELAGDELTIAQIENTIRRVRSKKRVSKIPIPVGMIKRMGEGGKMILWIASGGYHADIPALRAILPSLMTFEDWLKQHPS